MSDFEISTSTSEIRSIAWNIFKKHWGRLIGILIVLTAVTVMFTSVLESIFLGSSDESTYFFIYLVAPFVVGRNAWIYLKLVDEGSVDIKEAFRPFLQNIWVNYGIVILKELMIGFVIVSFTTVIMGLFLHTYMSGFTAIDPLIMGPGFLLLTVGAIVVALFIEVVFVFLYYLTYDYQGIGFFETIKVAFNLSKGNRKKILSLMAFYFFLALFFLILPIATGFLFFVFNTNTLASGSGVFLGVLVFLMAIVSLIALIAVGLQSAIAIAVYYRELTEEHEDKITETYPNLVRIEEDV